MLTLYIAGAAEAQGRVPFVAKAVRLIHAAPADAAQFSRVFGRPASAADSARITSDLSAVRRAGFQLPTVASGRTGVSETDAYRYQYENSSGTLFHLLGHNENGTFKFPDGSTRNIDSLKNPNNMYIAMSCHSSDFVNPEAGVGMDRAIDFTTGAAISKYLQNNMASYQQAGLGVSPPQVQG
jgi:hypothetical protein